MENLRIRGAQHRFAHLFDDGVQAMLDDRSDDWIEGHGGHPSNPNIILSRALAPLVPGIGHSTGLGQHQLDLAFCVRVVRDALWNDEHRAGRYTDSSIAKIDS